VIQENILASECNLIYNITYKAPRLYRIRLVASRILKGGYWLISLHLLAGESQIAAIEFYTFVVRNFLVHEKHATSSRMKRAKRHRIAIGPDI